MNILDVGIDDIIRSYKGESHKCMCGCSGKYYYPSLERYKKDNGHTGNQIKLFMVERILRHLKSNAEKVECENGLGNEVIFLLDDEDNKRWVLYVERR